jgi:hypothetical protein
MIGISDNGKPFNNLDSDLMPFRTSYKDFKHGLMFFGGLDGIEGIVD